MRCATVSTLQRTKSPRILSRESTSRSACPSLLHPGATTTSTDANCSHEWLLFRYSCTTSAWSDTTTNTCATPADTRSSSAYSIRAMLATGISECGSEYVTGAILLA